MLYNMEMTDDASKFEPDNDDATATQLRHRCGQPVGELFQVIGHTSTIMNIDGSFDQWQSR